jgi:hypothetical protein
MLAIDSVKRALRESDFGRFGAGMRPAPERGGAPDGQENPAFR